MRKLKDYDYCQLCGKRLDDITVNNCCYECFKKYEKECEEDDKNDVERLIKQNQRWNNA